LFTFTKLSFTPSISKIAFSKRLIDSIILLTFSNVAFPVFITAFKRDSIFSFTSDKAYPDFNIVL